MCMNIFLDEKKKITILQRFELSQFSFTLHIEKWHIVPSLSNQLLQEFTVYPLNILQLSFRHIEDVHEDFSW